MRRSSKPCDFCRDDWWFSDSDNGNTGHQLSVEVYPINNNIAIVSFAHDETGESRELSASIEMNFCPVCGRKLEGL